ncbi:c-type cytochrome [Hydrogenimonas thermophila]|uniref:Cytochrome C oxidase, cbb3-type, subunit III n=1 Tax=Hydrogenimonas thermophila TaxID=223786 RepID=A0A1I5LXT8_9BACT|nr:c-type cytochrome [Hydrogenimonas thermophila]SFP02168.1 Cytochrome C oxidase, cbb3-type, subunit III [Hydrogenimonas thermophila]
MKKIVVMLMLMVIGAFAENSSIFNYAEYEKACEQGDSVACVVLSSYELIINKNKGSSNKLISKACWSGDPTACSIIKLNTGRSCDIIEDTVLCNLTKEDKYCKCFYDNFANINSKDNNFAFILKFILKFPVQVEDGLFWTGVEIIDSSTILFNFELNEQTLQFIKKGMNENHLNWNDVKRIIKKEDLLNLQNKFISESALATGLLLFLKKGGKIKYLYKDEKGNELFSYYITKYDFEHLPEPALAKQAAAIYVTSIESGHYSCNTEITNGSGVMNCGTFQIKFSLKTYDYDLDNTGNNIADYVIEAPFSYTLNTQISTILKKRGYNIGSNTNTITPFVNYLIAVIDKYAPMLFITTKNDNIGLPRNRMTNSNVFRFKSKLYKVADVASTLTRLANNGETAKLQKLIDLFLRDTILKDKQNEQNYKKVRNRNNLKNTSVPISSSDTDDNGKLIYLNKCAGCHGIDGKGAKDKISAYGMKGGEYLIKELRDDLTKYGTIDGVLSIIHNGTTGGFGYPMGTMPGGLLVDETAEEVAKYVANDMKSKKPTVFVLCAGCHGADGKGMGGMTPNLTKYGTIDGVVDAINRGSKINKWVQPMPSFKNELTEKEKRDVAAYVLTFGKK